MIARYIFSHPTPSFSRNKGKRNESEVLERMLHNTRIDLSFNKILLAKFCFKKMLGQSIKIVHKYVKFFN